LSTPHCCPHCQRWFVPSPYRPQQVVCSAPACQRQRRAAYHRKKLATDPIYRQVVRDSQRQWWDEHPGYQKQRRRQHPEVVAANRQRQRQRDQKRRMQRLVRNNVALDLKASAAGIWLLTPPGSDLVRNNVACAQVVIFPPLRSTRVTAAAS
jgi:hypothetical protein